MQVRDGLNRDLVRSANDTLFLSVSEKQVLLREAAAAIRCYRALIALSGAAASDHEADITSQLDQFAGGIEFKYAVEINEIMLEAASTIRLLRLMIGVKQEIFDQRDP